MKKHYEERLKKERKTNNLPDAIVMAVKEYKDNYCLYSIWKLPTDKNFVLISTENREIAYRLGYEEIKDCGEITDMAHDS